MESKVAKASVEGLGNQRSALQIIILCFITVDTARLTGWVKPGENWQINIWIWIL